MCACHCTMIENALDVLGHDNIIRKKIIIHTFCCYYISQSTLLHASLQNIRVVYRM